MRHLWLVTGLVSCLFVLFCREHCFSFHLEATGPVPGAVMGLFSAEGFTRIQETGREIR